MFPICRGLRSIVLRRSVAATCHRLTWVSSVFLPFGTTNPAVCARPHLAIGLRFSGGNVRQSFDGSGGVHKLQMGVDVHRQANVTVTHELLGGAGRNAVAGQERGERVPQAVKIECLTFGVGLGDCRGLEVRVEDAGEIRGRIEKEPIPRYARTAGRRRASPPRLGGWRPPPCVVRS